MNCMTKIAIGLFLFFQYAVIAYGTGPGEAGGGGTIVSNPSGQSELLDLAIFKKQHPELALPRSEKRQVLPAIGLHSFVPLARLANDKFPIVQSALKKLELWGARPPSIIRALRDALTKAPIFYTNYRIGILDQNHWIPDDLKSSEFLLSMTTIAYYAKGWGILVSKSDFDALDHLNQVALLIHEALRHVQIHYKLRISNKTLQTLTAAIALEIHALPPDVNAELNKIYDSNPGRSSDQITDDFRKKRDEACQLVKSLPSQFQSDFESVSQRTCLADLINSQISSQEKNRHVEALVSAINDSISTAINLKNVTPISDNTRSDLWTPYISKMMNIRTGFRINLLEFNLQSEELQAAVRTLQDATLGLQHFSLDAAINGDSFILRLQLSELMKGLVASGVLIDGSTEKPTAEK